MTREAASTSSGGGARPSLVVADRNAVVRAGLHDFLSKQGHFDVAAVVDSGNALIDLCERRRPLIAVTGWSLHDMTALDVLATLRRRQLPTRTVIYAAEDGSEQLRQAARSGAWGYVSRNEDPELLLDTLAAVARGRGGVQRLLGGHAAARQLGGARWLRAGPIYRSARGSASPAIPSNIT